MKRGWVCAVNLAADLIFCPVYIGFHLALHKETVSVCCWFWFGRLQLVYIQLYLAVQFLLILFWKLAKQIYGQFCVEDRQTDRQTRQHIEAPSRSLTNPNLSCKIRNWKSQSVFYEKLPLSSIYRLFHNEWYFHWSD